MRRRSNPCETSQDVVVVGAGIGGLTAGALLAKAGKKVLVVDDNERPGGYARTIREGPYCFDTAVHLISGCESAGPFGPGLIDSVLRQLGVRERCEFLRVDPIYTARFPEFRLDVPAGRDAFVEAHARHFPQQAPGLRRLLDLCSEINRQLLEFPVSPRLRDWLLLPRRFPALYRHRNATLLQVMDRHISDQRVMALFAALWPYVGLAPSSASFLTYAAMMASYIEEGAFYCRGSFQTVADAFAEAVTKHGGELLLGTRVSRILTERHTAAGVLLEDGNSIRAPIVISNADARHTFERLLDPETLPRRFMRRLRRLRPAISVGSLYLATDLEVGEWNARQETLVYASWDPERVYDEAMSSRISGVAVTIPTMIESALAPTGEHIVILMGVLPSGSGELPPGERAKIAGQLLDLGETVIPGLRDHITFCAGDSQDVEQGLSVKVLGPIYGWEVSPQQSGPRRLAHETPISGLYLSGHWSRPSHGIYGVVWSGIQTARIILGERLSEGPIPI